MSRQEVKVGGVRLPGKEIVQEQRGSRPGALAVGRWQRRGLAVLLAPKGTLRSGHGGGKDVRRAFGLGGCGQQDPHWWQLGRLTGRRGGCWSFGERGMSSWDGETGRVDRT